LFLPVFSRFIFKNLSALINLSACPTLPCHFKMTASFPSENKEMTTSDPQSDLLLTTKQFAARLFMELHKAILDQEEGALRGEVEAIHDMRVAIRRQRVAIRNFASCLPEDARRRLNGQMKKLALALGEVRDLDVMIKNLETALLTRSTQDQQAIKNFISRLRSRRRRQFRRLKQYLQNEEFADFKKKFISSESENRIEKQKVHGQAA
jgi:CHAD domain-containing protein